MNLRDALISQAPSLALQRAAQAEIARLDAEIVRLTEDLRLARAPHGKPANETVKEADRG